ncbi:signal transduction protein, partial [Enterococcus hirae]
AMGLAISKTFNGHTEGPLGIAAFWQHGVHSAALCQALAQRMPKQLKIKPGLAYLGGLLHNFGFLLLGHIARAEFFLLNRVVEANPDVPI